MAYLVERPAISYIATSQSGNLLAASEFQEVVHIFDLNTLRLHRTIQTTLDPGGPRTAISEDGMVLIAGAYTRYGVSAYAVADGKELWRRKDLKKLQEVNISPFTNVVRCRFEIGRERWLDLATGADIEPVQKVRTFYESTRTPVRVEVRSNDSQIVFHDGPPLVFPRKKSEVMSGAVSPDVICLEVAETSVRSLRFLSAQDGSEVTRYVTTDDNIFLSQFAYSEPLNAFVGISQPNRRDVEGPRHLNRFDSTSYKPIVICEIPREQQAWFCQNASRLVMKSGMVFDVPSGKKLGVLPFPTKMVDMAPYMHLDGIAEMLKAENRT